jgi:hypothetical protein
MGHRGGDYGLLPAELVGEMARSENAWMRRLVCDPTDGRLLDMDTTRRRFSGVLRKFILYRDGVSRRPYSDTPIHDIDHVVPHAEGGPTSAANGHGLAKRDHRLRDQPGWRLEPADSDTGRGVTWITPTDHAYESRPPPLLGHGNTRRPRRGRSDQAAIGLLLLHLLLGRRRE